MLSPVAVIHHTAICKRDGTWVAFDPDKIRQAIIATGRASDEFVDAAMAEELLDAVLAHLEDVPELHVEEIQDRVERVLMDAGFFLALRAYIVYREQHGPLRSGSASQVSSVLRCTDTPAQPSHALVAQHFPTECQTPEHHTEQKDCAGGLYPDKRQPLIAQELDRGGRCWAVAGAVPGSLSSAVRRP